MRLTPWLALSVGTTLFLPASLWAGPPESVPVKHLVEQLGSKRFRDREAAAQALDAIGAPALEELKKAANSPDLEVARRAQELAARIQVRTDGVRLAAARRVRVVYQGIPLSDAVADFNKKTGLQIQLAGDPVAVGSRKVRLDTGDVPVWDAFAQFCQQAGLMELSLLPPEAQQQALKQWRARPTPAKSDDRDDLNERVVRALLTTARDAGGQSIVLVPGQQPALATTTAGALRIRALPTGTPGWGQTPGVSETSCKLEIAPQPGCQWLEVLDVRVRRAVDDKGQELTQLIGNEDQGNPYRLNELMALRFRQQLIVAQMGDVVVCEELPTDRWSLSEVRLQLGKGPSRSLKTLRGVVSGRISSTGPLVTVPNILKAKGTTTPGEDGRWVKVLDVRSDNSGVVTVRARTNGVSSRGAADLALQDSQGRYYETSWQSLEGENGNGQGGGDWSYLLRFRRQRGQGDPAQLVLSGRRVVTVEVPFTLENVPLP